MAVDSIPSGLNKPGIASVSQIFGGPSASPSASALPTGAGAAAGPLDMQAMLRSLGSPQISNEDIIKAMTPISGQTTPQMPGAFTRPIPDFQPAPLSHDPNIVGAGNARAEGIGNTVTAGMNIIGAIATKHAQNKQMADATKVQNFLGAVDGLNQAKQLLAQDPNNAAAKEALDKNQTLINGMFMDPKFKKTVEKGFQVSLTDPSQNKTPDHSIVQQGIALFHKQQQQPTTPQEAAGMAQRFLGQQPTRLGPNTLAQQQLQMKMSQQKLASDVLKTYMPVMVQGMKLDQAKALQHSREIYQSQMQYNTTARQFAITNARIVAGKDMQTRSFFHQESMEVTRQQNRISLLNEAVAAHASNPIAIQGLIQKENAQYETEKAARETRIASYEAQITHIVNAQAMYTSSPEQKQRKEELARTIQQLRQSFDELDTKHAAALASINAFIPAGAAAGGTGADSTVTDTGADGVGVTSDPDEYDPSSLDPSQYEGDYVVPEQP
jgi:hypothetical protein